MKTNIVILLSIVTLVNGCPEYCNDINKDDIAPCTCQDGRVRCVAIDDVDLDSVFAYIADGIAYGTREYESFELESTYISTLGPAAFHGLLFKKFIFTTCSNLTCISPAAFEGQKSTTIFTAENTPFSSPVTATCDLFSALSTLTNVNQINIVNHRIPQIPDNAFNDKMGVLENLRTIDLHSTGSLGTIISVGNNSFSTLKNLNMVNLSNQKIVAINDSAFQFPRANWDHITINLEHNNLNGSRLGSHLFPTNKVTTLMLAGNMNLTYLPDGAFYDFFEERGHDKNTCDMLGIQMEIDRLNMWLVDNKVTMKLDQKLLHAMGKDGTELLKHTHKQMDVAPPAANAHYFGHLPVDILPCTCHNNHIKCVATTKELDLDDFFDALAHVTNDTLYYKSFELVDTAITYLPPAAFHGVQFGELKFTGCSNLQCVDPRAFEGLAYNTTSFMVEVSDFRGVDPPNSTCNLFAALSTLTNVETINIVGSELTVIPDNAFNHNTGALTRLKNIDFGGRQTKGKIYKVGKRAFSTLKNLNMVDLSNQKIVAIGDSAFQFPRANWDHITVNLEHNSLNGSSFGSHVFPTNKVTTLMLAGNVNLTPFYDFFEERGHDRNTCYMLGIPMEIDRYNMWLVDNIMIMKLDQKLLNAMGEDGILLLRHTHKQMDVAPPAANAL
ncbi:unnamed protein product, partial [Oppiella nova]